MKNKSGVEDIESMERAPAKTSWESNLSTSKTLSVSKKSQRGISTPASVRQSQAGSTVDINRKNARVSRGAKIVKPVFTVGRNDSSSKSSKYSTVQYEQWYKVLKIFCLQYDNNL